MDATYRLKTPMNRCPCVRATHRVVVIAESSPMRMKFGKPASEAMHPEYVYKPIAGRFEARAGPEPEESVGDVIEGFAG